MINRLAANNFSSELINSIEMSQFHRLNSNTRTYHGKRTKTYEHVQQIVDPFWLAAFTAVWLNARTIWKLNWNFLFKPKILRQILNSPWREWRIYFFLALNLPRRYFGDLIGYISSSVINIFKVSYEAAKFIFLTHTSRDERTRIFFVFYKSTRKIWTEFRFLFEVSSFLNRTV